MCAGPLTLIRRFSRPPITYQIDGIQYVAILAGTGGGDLFWWRVEQPGIHDLW